MELVEGKSGAELTAALQHIPGRENVRWVTLDMSDSYRSFARSFFPKAQVVADKFHVLRLLTPAIHRALRALNLPKEALPMYRVLRKNPSKLSPTWRWKLRVNPDGELLIVASCTRPRCRRCISRTPTKRRQRHKRKTRS